MAQMANQSPGAFRSYRWKELGLFIIPFAILLLEMTQLLFVRGADPNASVNLRNFPIIQGLLPIIGLIAALFAAHVVLNIFFRKADQVLLPLVGLLSGMGVLMATRLGPDLYPVPSPSLGTNQLTWVILGLVLCMGTLFLLRNTSWLERYKYTWALASFVLLLPSVIKGVGSLHSNAPTRDSLGIGGSLNLQPSELLKICLVIFFAGYLNENRDVLARGYIYLGRLRLPPLRQLGPLVLMLIGALLIFLVVRELGLALLIYGLFLSMTYLASGKLTYVLVALGIFALLAYIAFQIPAIGYIRARFATVSFDAVNWQNWTPAQLAFYQGSGGYQVVQGLIALSSGGIFGAGFGLGHPTIVSVVQSDMILTGLGEEFGLIGLFALIGIYLLIVYRGFRIAIEAPDAFNKLLAAGLTTIFAIQTMIICAGNLKLMPLTGIPLPFLSQGGSSVIANFIIVGILLRISHNTAMERDSMA